MGKFELRSLFANSKVRLFIVALLLIYVVVFHVFHTNIWRTSSKKYFLSGNTDWLKFWKASSDESGQDGDHFVADIHFENMSYGKEDPKLVIHGKDVDFTLPRVAIGSGITSKRQESASTDEMGKNFQLFSKFLPSFCRTASPGYSYHFYLAFDATDRLFRNPEFLSKFLATFGDITTKLCPHLGTVALHMVQCTHTGKPAWAQNDAMMEAYLDNVDYHFRVNDDTVMQTGNWTRVFVDVLDRLDPPRVGVTGPNHSGGNTAILTYDFVHRTHIDIFGFYYPRIFTDWYADGWITRTYRPDRSIKVSHIHLVHTLSLGQRYRTAYGKGDLQAPRVKRDKVLLDRFINFTRIKETIKIDGKKVISMSLFGQDPKYLWGAIRNAQIAPIFFPGWKLRIFVPSNDARATGNSTLLVPDRILNKLRQLGAEIAYVKTRSIPPVFWRYLVVDDNSVDYFIIRNAHSRLSERDAIVVNDWMDHQDPKSEANSLHCIRDHPTHANRSIVDGLWGGNRDMVRRRLGQDMSSLLDTFTSGLNRSIGDRSLSLVYSLAMSYRNPTSQNTSFSILDDILWPLMKSVSFCHDSVSCEKWPRSRLFPVNRMVGEYLGQAFDEHQEATINKNDEQLLDAVGLRCTNTTVTETTTIDLTTSTSRNPITTTFSLSTTAAKT